MTKTVKFTSITGDTFREIFQSSSEGIIMIDKEGTILLANPVSERMFGYEPDKLIGQPLEVLLPKRYQKKHTGLREQFNENPSPRRMGVGRDLMAVRKDGSEFPVEVSLSHKEIRDQFLVMAFIIDITERKKSEEAIKRSEEQLLVYAAELERKVEARTEALNASVLTLERTNNDLQQQITERKRAEEEARRSLEREREVNELKSKFVSIASHEFRTPLSTVLSSVSLIGQYLQKNEPEKAEKHVQRIKSSVNHLTSILNDLLSLGKLDEGKIEAVKDEINLDDFFLEVFEEIKPTLKEEQALLLKVSGTTRKVFTDPMILRNILFNLISNAAKYSDSGKTIRVTLEYETHSFSISVSDEGIGIPDEEIKHIFERFFRARNVSNIQGTGLGLNIVKRYVDLLNGNIQFVSKEKKGSTFTVSFPNH